MNSLHILLSVVQDCRIGRSQISPIIPQPARRTKSVTRKMKAVIGHLPMTALSSGQGNGAVPWERESPPLLNIVSDRFLSSVSTSGATGSSVGTATAASASYGARLSAPTLAHGGEEGKSTMGIHPLTLNTGYGIIGLAHGPQDVELDLTIVTVIFVDRHGYHLLQLFSVTFYLSSFIWSRWRELGKPL